MSTAESLQNVTVQPKSLSNSSHAGWLLQRKCACGLLTSSLTGECAECTSKKRLQTKLTIGASNDPFEKEADRVADQVMAAPSFSTVGSTPIRIQRLTGSPSAEMGASPDSVDRALAGSGRPLEPSLRQEMEQRFGHDFSRVRVHSGSAAEQSARDVNANAYTVGHNVVFGAGRLTPGTYEGRRLIAHELTHVVQQSKADGIRAGQSYEKRGLSSIFDRSRTTSIQGRAVPTLQRAPSGDGGRSYEAGAIGSLQFCINFCTGDFEINGWIWVGGGTRVLKTFIGPSAMYEGTIAKGNEPSLGLLKSICGECDPECDAKKGYLGDSGLAAGIPIFGDLVHKGSKNRPCKPRVRSASCPAQ